MIVGITGGIATGKSLATQVLADLGVRIIDADEISHYLTTYSPTVLYDIRDHFGVGVFQEQGALDRRHMAEIIFNDPIKRQVLQDILHPPISQVVDLNLDFARAHEETIVLAAPLLIEVGMHTKVDRLWVIACDEKHQISRLCKRSDLTEQAAAKWIESQMPLAEKKKLADTVITNNGTIDQFKAKVKADWELLFAPL